jgi:hydrogenase expression/formation protein HypE
MSSGGRLDLAHGRVDMTHGGGGRAMARLIDQVFRHAFDNPVLAQGNDAAAFDWPGGRTAMTTDSYVVQPLSFPGGDIGDLAVNGTVNDLATAGAVPVYLSAGFVLEEGLPLAELCGIVRSMARAAETAGVRIVTGDTKVVERGKADGLYINTAGLGRVPEGVAPSSERARPGDRLLVSGPLGDHGIAILSAREEISLDAGIASDTAALNGLVADMVAAAPGVRTLRDLTRGGLAAACNELAQAAGVGMTLDQAALPVRAEVAAACEVLGLDPVHVANEGCLLAIAAPEDAGALLEAMRTHPLGRAAAEVGEVMADERRLVELRTTFGGRRLVDWLNGEQLPRIC